MKVSGFTFVKNAIVYDYPIVEAIRSILPICDEVVVAVGKSDDETLALIQSIDPVKVRIIETEWDESLREGGRVLALETDKAFQAISKDSVWAFYIQGDEVVHEQDLEVIKSAMQRFEHEDQVDGLLFNYKHFYGSYDYIGASSTWYPNEIRVIKNNPKIYSYRDAQGFRKNENEKLNVVDIPASIYHYGWVKKPEAMQRKQENFNKYWHDDAWVDQNVLKAEAYDYEKHVRQLLPFRGSHPQVMLDRIARLNWKFDYDLSLNKPRLKDRMKRILKKIGIEANYTNYKIVKL